MSGKVGLCRMIMKSHLYLYFQPSMTHGFHPNHTSQIDQQGQGQHQYTDRSCVVYSRRSHQSGHVAELCL